MTKLTKVHKRLVRKRRERDVKEIQDVLRSFERYLHKQIGNAKRTGEGRLIFNTSFYVKNKAWVVVNLVITNIRTKSKIHMDIFRFKPGVPTHEIAKSISEARWILREFLGKEIIRYKIPVPDATLEKEFLQTAIVTRLR